jgi:hypothetical protein
LPITPRFRTLTATASKSATSLERPPSVQSSGGT